MKPLFLKMHRWITLIFALPLAVVIVTGLILSFEPIATSSAVKPSTVTGEALTAALQRHDPGDKARMIAMDHQTGAVSIIGPDARASVSLATGEASGTPAASSTVFRTARSLHEHLVFGAGWLVTVSTYAMLVTMVIGVLLGLPRLRNTVSGWHKGVAWFLLPLLFLSPLTGLGIVHGVSFSGPTPTDARAEAPASIREALPVIAKSHDPSRILWVRKRGNSVLLRVLEDQEYRIYAVTKAGTVAMPRNWSRLLHEGNGFGTAGALVNVLTSIAMMTLMGTGLFIWARRNLNRQRNRRMRKLAASS
ncbi:MAG: PepSY domain-containing protein [Hyphomicrobiaceae bacterium]